MLGLNRQPPTPDPRTALKTPLGPAPANAPASPPPATPAAVGRTSQAPGTGDALHPAHEPSAPIAAPATEPLPSKLFVGINIKLKGVAISDCDVLVVEGQVEATVSSKAMEIAKPGSFVGTATIDVAEIHGDFSGEITARTRLVVHGTGRVSGTIRYGKLIVAEGGEVSGDVRQIDAAAREPVTTPARDGEAPPTPSPLFAREERNPRVERVAPTPS